MEVICSCEINIILYIIKNYLDNANVRIVNKHHKNRNNLEMLKMQKNQVVVDVWNKFNDSKLHSSREENIRHNKISLRSLSHAQSALLMSRDLIIARICSFVTIRVFRNRYSSAISAGFQLS